MEFGAVQPSELSRIDFSDVPDDERTIALLKARHTGRSDELRVGVGCPVWSVKDWVGKVYPRGSETNEFLFHYSHQFTSIELNTTHYRIPDDATITRWRTQTPEEFRFNPKFPQEVSHRQPLSSRVDVALQFIKAVERLEDRLGISFLQMPPTFSPHDLDELRRFLGRLPKDFALAVEVRHPDFFKDHRLATSYYDLLEKLGKHTVITDVAGRRDVLHTSLTSGRCLVRFIGNDLHPTDLVRIEHWTDRLSRWIDLGLEQVEFFMHQPEDRNAPDAVVHFVDSLNLKAKLNLKKWKPENKGEQLGFF